MTETSSKTLSILIVDDDTNTTSLLTALLELEGSKVDFAPRLATARVMLAKHLPDVLLLDYHLAEGAGTELLPELRKTPAGRNVIVVGISGLTEAYDAMMNAGVDAFLSKPIEPDDLPPLFRELIERRKQSDIPQTHPRTAILEKPAEIAPDKSKFILMVEDEETISRLVADFFTKHSYTVSIFSDAPETINFLRRSERLPSLILCDLALPSMHGFELYHLIKKEPAWRHILFIFVTSTSDTESITAAFDMGAGDYVVKPFELRELLARVNRLLSRKYLEGKKPAQNDIVISSNDQSMTSSIKAYLEKVNFHIHEVLEGTNILDLLFFNAHIDAILLDIPLPDIDWLEFVSIVRDNPIGQQIPILIVTDENVTETIVKALDQGVDDYIVKPFEVKELERRIQRFFLESQESSATLQSMIQVVHQEPLADNSKTILFVEDEILLAKDLAEYMAYEGYEVLIAENGRMALEMLANASSLPCLILSDIAMPQMDGYAFLREINKNPAWRHIFFIFLSARDYRKGFETGIILNPDDYITKPFLPRELLESIERLCTQQLPPLRSSERNQRLLALTTAEDFNKDTQNGAEIEQRFIVMGYLMNDFRYGVARLDPGCIVLFNPPHSSKTLQTLRRFELSENVPVVLALEKLPSLSEYLDLYTAGADEICQYTDIVKAVNTAVAQYDTPALVETGEAWQVLLVSPDSALCQAVSKDLTSTFYAEVTSTDKPTSNDAWNLVLLDTEVANYPVIFEKLRYTTPIILLTDDEVLAQRQQELGLRGCLLKPIKKSHLIPTIERLLRWRQKRKTLPEIWGGYAVFAVELDYENGLRQQLPELAAMMVEAGVLYSGLIHDLRNSVYSLNSQITVMERRDKSGTLKSTLSEISLEVQYATFLLEMIASGRFKGVWNPKEHQAFTQWVEQGIGLARLACPQAKFTLENTLKQPPTLIADAQQITQLLTTLLILLANKSAEVSIQFGEEATLLFKSSAYKTEVLQKLFAPENTDLLSLNARKLVVRHNGALNVKDDTLILSLPVGGWREDRALRLEIASLANRCENLKEQLDNLKPLPQNISLAPLVTSTAIKLVAQVGHIVDLCERLGEDGKRMVITARFGLLLAHNLLVTSVGFKPEPEPLALEPLFEHVTQLRKDFLRECEVIVRVEPGTPHVLADELGLLQVLVNLVTNAVEAMSGEGKLTILAKPHPDGVQISIADTGHGISSEQLERIFELSFTTKSGQERGVGLHIVSSIVRELNGKIEVQSTVGEGTTFTIALPAANIL